MQILNQNADLRYFQDSKRLRRMGNGRPGGQGAKEMMQPHPPLTGGTSASDTHLTLSCPAQPRTSHIQVFRPASRLSSPAKSVNSKPMSALPWAPNPLSYGPENMKPLEKLERRGPYPPLLLIPSATSRRGSASSFPTAPQVMTNNWWMLAHHWRNLTIKDRPETTSLVVTTFFIPASYKKAKYSPVHWAVLGTTCFPASMLRWI